MEGYETTNPRMLDCTRGLDNGLGPLPWIHNAEREAVALTEEHVVYRLNNAFELSLAKAVPGQRNVFKTEILAQKWLSELSIEAFPKN